MTSIFSTFSSTGPRSKTHVLQGTLPSFIDPRQPPTKKSPWRQIQSTPFISSLTLTIPSALYNIMRPQTHAPSSPEQPQQLKSSHLTPSPYAKVILTLAEILTGLFFTTHIKTGNVLLISSGQPGISSWFCTLLDGKLTLEMARDVYERCGLQGVKTERNGGARKHGKDRWTVEMDLRAPAMVRGKKGFEKLVRAAIEVLNDARVWLFRDLATVKPEMGPLSSSRSGEDQDILRAFHPTIMSLEPREKQLPKVLIPSMVSRSKTNSAAPFEFHDDYYELIEWLDLVQLDSPRVRYADDTDQYICRYSVPDADTAKSTDLTVLTWTGLLDRDWCMQLLLEMICLSRKLKSSEWLTFTITAHKTEALGQIQGSMTLLQASDDEPNIDVQEGDKMDVDGELGTATKRMEDRIGTHGLQQFLCFEFVDTVTK